MSDISAFYRFAESTNKFYTDRIRATEYKTRMKTKIICIFHATPRPYANDNKMTFLHSFSVYKWTSTVKAFSAIGQQQARSFSRTGCLASTHPDYYRTLHVSTAATQREIREAYNTLCKVFDPKKHKDNATKLQRIREAYAVLGNVSSRRMFDQGN